MTPEELAKILYEEFERDDWGDIDPALFDQSFDDTIIATEIGPDESRDLLGMHKVLERAAKRIAKREQDLRDVLAEIGNRAGRPTMTYAPKVENTEREESLKWIVGKVMKTLKTNV